MRKSIVGILVLITAVSLVAWQHDKLTRFAITAFLAHSLGDAATLGDLRINGDRIELDNIVVTQRLQPVLTARRVTVLFSWRDLLPESRHRFGVRSLDVDHAHLTIRRFADGTSTIPVRAPTGPQPLRAPNATPLAMMLRVRQSSLTVIDDRDRAAQTVDHLTADGEINSQGRSQVVLSAIDSTDAKNTLRFRGAIDQRANFAAIDATMPHLSVIPLFDVFIGSQAIRFPGGVLKHLWFHAGAFTITNGLPSDLSYVLTTEVAQGKLVLPWLAEPITHIDGPITITDGILSLRNVVAVVARTPLVASGLLRFGHQAHIALRVDATGNLAQARNTLSYLRAIPIRGKATLALSLGGLLEAPHLAIRIVAESAHYGDFPLHALQANVAIENGTIIIARAHALYNNIPLSIHGVLTPGQQLQSEFAVHAATIGAHLDYLAQINPHQHITLDAVAHGSDLLFSGSALLHDTRGETVAFAQVWPDGRLRVAPLWVRTPKGSLAGGYTLDRRTMTSAAWLSTHHLAVNVASVPLPGLTLPNLPVTGRLDAVAALTTHKDKSAIAARLHLVGGQLGTLTSQDARAVVSGSLGLLAVDPISVTFPWGTFRGSGVVANERVLLGGIAHASLSRLPIQTNSPALTGVADGPVVVALDSQGVDVSTSGTTLRGSTVAGVPVTRLSGQVHFANGGIHIDQLLANAGGGSVVATGDGKLLAVAARDVNLSSLTGVGLLGATGQVSFFGTVDPANPSNADITASLTNGQVAGYAMAGTAQLGIRGSQLHVRNGLGRLDGLATAFDGQLWGLGRGAPSYDFTTHIAAADLSNVADALGYRASNLTGTFRSDLHVTGRGLDALVAGPVVIPISNVLGQSIHNARGTLIANSEGVTVTDGTLRVGSTNAQFYALSHQTASALSLIAPSADLSDFNDLFDTGDTLAGKGSLDVSFVSAQQHLSTDGTINIHHFRFRRFPFGHTAAHWSSFRNTIDGALTVDGKHGHFAANGALTVAPTARVERILGLARYDASLHVRGLDVSLYRTLVGAPMLPLLGSLDGNVTARGRLPDLGLAANAVLSHGSFGATPIDQLSFSLSGTGERISISQARLNAVGLDAAAVGSFGWQPKSSLALSVAIHAAHINDVVERITHQVLPVSGAIDSTLLVGGTMEAPKYSGAVDAHDLNIYGVKVPSLVGSAALTGSKLELRDLEADFGKQGSIVLAGVLPLRLSPFSLGGAAEPLSFDLAVGHLTPEVFAPLLGSHTSLGGTLDGHIGLAGRVGSPTAIGQLRLSNGSYVGPYNATSVGKVDATLNLAGTTVALPAFRAMVGGGLVTGHGTIDLGKGLNDPARLSYKAFLVARGARVDINGIGRGSVDANLALRHAASSTLPTLDGDATITDAAVPFAAFLAPSASTGAPPPYNAALNLALHAGQNVRVVGNGYGAGLDIAGRGNVDLRGTIANPTLEGSFIATSGTLTYLDRAFNVVRAKVAFSPKRGLIPTLDAAAQTHVTDTSGGSNLFGSTEITVSVTGPIDNLNVDLQSSPPGYTRDQLLALLTPLGGLAGVGRATGLGGSNGTTIGQEAFNLVNAQFGSALLAPLSNAIGKSLGIGNVGLSFDYFGNVSFTVHRPIGRGFSASYSSTYGLISTQTIGLEYAPTPSTIAELAFYTQRVASSISTGLRTTTIGPNGSLVIPAQSGSGFSFTLRRLFGWGRSRKEPTPPKRTGPTGS